MKLWEPIENEADGSARLYTRAGDVTNELVYHGRTFLRIAVNCPELTSQTDIPAFSAKYLPEHLRVDDFLILSAEDLSIVQQRYYEKEGLAVSWSSKLLYWLFAYRGDRVGFYSDRSCMEVAVLECGILKILFVAAVGLVEKVAGKKGWMWKMAGEKLRRIRPGREKNQNLVLLCPDHKEVLVDKIAFHASCRTVLMDLHSPTGKAEILASSESLLPEEELIELMTEAPMLLYNGRTSFCIIRAKV